MVPESMCDENFEEDGEFHCKCTVWSTAQR